VVLSDGLHMIANGAAGTTTPSLVRPRTVVRESALRQPVPAHRSPDRASWSQPVWTSFGWTQGWAEHDSSGERGCDEPARGGD